MIIAQQLAGAGEVPEDRIAMICRQAAVDRRWAPVELADWLDLLADRPSCAYTVQAEKSS